MTCQAKRSAQRAIVARACWLILLRYSSWLALNYIDFHNFHRADYILITIMNTVRLPQSQLILFDGGQSVHRMRHVARVLTEQAPMQTYEPSLGSHRRRAYATAGKRPQRAWS